MKDIQKIERKWIKKTQEGNKKRHKDNKNKRLTQDWKKGRHKIEKSDKQDWKRHEWKKERHKIERKWETSWRKDTRMKEGETRGHLAILHVCLILRSGAF